MTNEYYYALLQHQALCMNIYAHFIFAGDINFPQKLCCATHYFSIVGGDM
jgi:hypothetical protein